MAHVLTLINSKGGVGKTTSTLNIGAYMAMKGMKVLLIDADAQYNLTHILCGNEEHAITLRNALLGDESLPIEHLSPRMALVPGGIGLAGMDATNIPGTHVLENLIKPHRNEYDYIIIDCPPCLNLITYNVIQCSDFILVPMLGEYLSMQGLEAIEKIIEMVNNSSHANKSIGGIFFSRYKENRGMDRLTKKRVIAAYGTLLMKTFIHENVALAESAIAHKSIFEYRPRCKGARDYEALTKELISKVKKHDK